jgi:hypothetical protein
LETPTGVDISRRASAVQMKGDANRCLVQHRLLGSFCRGAG